MCGLAGVYSTSLTEKEKKAFKNVLLISQLRGDHSTGMAVVTLKKKKKFRWECHRELGDSTSFLKKPEVEDLLKKPNTFLLMGHTRFTTSGVTNLHNAHPINEKHITGCHNGVIHSLDPKPGEDKEKVTDSRKLFGIIASEGMEKAIEAARYGSMALTFIDKSKRTFNIFKDDGRTLFLTHDKEQKTYLWASEAEFLKLSIEREHLKDWADPYPVEPYQLYTWQIGSPKFETTKFKKPVITYTPFVYRPSKNVSATDYSGRQSYGRVNHATYSIDPWEDQWPDPDEVPPGESRFERYGDFVYCSVCWETPEECLCEEAEAGTKLYCWYAGQRSPVDTMANLLANGCFNCQRKYTVEDIVYWPHWDYYLCKECFESDFFREALKHTTSYMGSMMG